MAIGDKQTPEVPGVKTLEGDARAASENMGISFPDSNGKERNTEDAEKNNLLGRKHSESILTNADDVFDVSGAFGTSNERGTLITDKRLHRRGFFETITSAFKEWAGDKEEFVRTSTVFRKRERPKVITPKARREIITEAGKISIQAPRDDHSAVVEKLRRERVIPKLPEIEKPYLIKDEKIGEQAEWVYRKELEHELNPDIKVPDDTRKVAESAFPLPTASHELPQTTPKKEADSIVSLLERFDSLPNSNDLHSKISGSEQTNSTPFVSNETPLEKEVLPIEPTLPDEKTTPKVPPIPQTRTQPTEEAREQKSVPPTTPPTSKEESDWSYFSGAQIEKEEVKPQAPILPSISEAISGYDAFNKNLSPESYPEPRENASIKLPESPETLGSDSFTLPKRADDMRIEERQFTVPEERVTKQSEREVRVPIQVNVVLLFTIIAIIGIALGVGTAYFFGLFPNDDDPVEIQTTVPSYIMTDAQVAVPLLRDKSELLKNLSDAMRYTNAGSVHVYPTITNEESGVAVPAETSPIMDVLAPRAPGNFLRSLNQLTMFGSIEGKPFIILKTTDFDTAFAGMIAWEKNILEDLAPMFGEKIEKSIVPQGARVTELIPPRFVDATENNRSIRILYDESGNERIIYAFVSKSMCIITKDTETLSKVLGKI